ncbi:MAG: hypothetical protein Q7T82_17770 [Armatimonadota bacterium]|nr:hypothetical protein [Armatimonadota bacterium]
MVFTRLSGLILATAMAAMMVAPVCGGSSVPPRDRVLVIRTVAKTSEAQGADVSIHRLQNHSGVVHAMILNNQRSDQPVLVRFEELTEPEYDVYIDNSRLGTYQEADLQLGLGLTLKAGTLPDDRPLIQQVSAASGSLLKLLQESPCADSSLVIAVLSNVRMWSQTADARLRNSAIAYVLLNPSVRPLTSTSWKALSSKQVAIDTAKYWKAIQDERWFVYRKVQNILLRDMAISTITPIDIKAKLIPSESGGTLTCTLTNRSDVAISGKLIVETRQGLKPPPAARFKSLGRGKTLSQSFRFASGAVKPEQLRLRMEINVGGAGFTEIVPTDRA